MRIISAIALLLVIGAFQNCAKTGFESGGVGNAAFNSKSNGGGDGGGSGVIIDPSPITPRKLAIPTGDYVIDKIWNKFVCKASGDMACPALYATAQQISRALTLSLSANGSYSLTAKCFREFGQAKFYQSGTELYVRFQASDVTPMLAEVGCDVTYNKDLIFQQALDLFHKSSHWIASSIEGYKNTDTLTDDKEHYLLLNKLKKVDPVVVETFYVNGVEQIQTKSVSYTPMHEKVIFKLSSDRKFSLTSQCLAMTGSMPLVGGSTSGFAIKVIVNSLKDTCPGGANYPAGDATLLAYEVLKGGVDYSISATGQPVHRIRDAKGRSLYMSKEQQPIYVSWDY
jgi:hypothetical protein